jgi:hypothetical protein
MTITPPAAGGGGIGRVLPGEEDPLMGGVDVGPVATLAPDVAQIKNQALVPFVAWDTTVEADHEYKYQVRVHYVNPMFNFDKGLAKEDMKSVPLLVSAWVEVPGSVRIKPDTVFFVTNQARGGATGPKVGAEVKLFKRTAGKWYGATFDVQAGMPISYSIPLLEGGKTIEVNTGYTLVDAQAAGNGVHAVLVDGSGRMTTRDSADDRANPARTELEASAQKPAPVSRPATLPGRGPVRGGRGTPPARGPVDELNP